MITKKVKMFNTMRINCCLLPISIIVISLTLLSSIECFLQPATNSLHLQHALNHHHQHQFTQQLPLTLSHNHHYSSSSSNYNQNHNQPNLLDKCPNGAPLQWRPHLDVSSKAHLAPIVLIGSLKNLTFTPITFQAGGQNQMSSFNQHAQSINNLGINIECTFVVLKVLKKLPNSINTATAGNSLKQFQVIKLIYRISPSLSTTKALLQLIETWSFSNQSAASEQQVDFSHELENGKQLFRSSQRHFQLRNSNNNDQQQTQQSPMVPCALELSESELVKKASKLFKLNQNYILYLNQADYSTAANYHQQQQHMLASKSKQPPSVFNYNRHNQQQVGALLNGNIYPHGQQLNQQKLFSQTFYPFPFASHEQLTNQTGKALFRILCKNCAQVPQVQLVNSTFVSVAQRGASAGANASAPATAAAAQASKIRLDCKVTGYPTPWVQWFRNGKLLRNKVGGRLSIKTDKWKKRHNVQLSRLELNLQHGRNETGIYECRAMSVVAREPSIGTYTLLVLPAHYALIPIQAELDNNGSGGATGAPAAPASVPSGPEPDSRAAEAATSGATPASVSAAGATASAATTTTSTTTPAPETPARGPGAQEAANYPAEPALSSLAASSTEAGASANKGAQQQQVVGLPCPLEARDNFCLNRGTCVHIEHIKEYYCSCADGYYGHRCEYKSPH